MRRVDMMKQFRIHLKITLLLYVMSGQLSCVTSDEFSYFDLIERKDKELYFSEPFDNIYTFKIFGKVEIVMEFNANWMEQNELDEDPVKAIYSTDTFNTKTFFKISPGGKYPQRGNAYTVLRSTHRYKLAQYRKLFMEDTLAIQLFLKNGEAQQYFFIGKKFNNKWL